MITTREDFVKAALNEFESPLIGYATTFLHDVERARDVVQDTFIRLYQQDVDKVKGGLKAWLFTVCRNRALDVIRKERRITNLEEEQMARVPSGRRTPSERADLEERVGQVHEALNRLSENQREVILLKFEQGLSYEEISEVTGLSSGNVGFLLHTGLKRLRSFLPDDLVQNLTPQTA
ncbi:sigma-70 family RNA polymerase sigma factor [Akkermansiaceae bacterium]|jgi:RNA polymerase sigma-70 factor (ECF subfamily)|nr:sigma-70 family RNA polymerase sigma factor [bacterium]MDB4680419.1 sigma-70 family RNA polymerase sigma factor [Akkermansiaceae bacterium]